jgi:hypothetical protein
MSESFDNRFEELMNSQQTKINEINNELSLLQSRLDEIFCILGQTDENSNNNQLSIRRNKKRGFDQIA